MMAGSQLGSQELTVGSTFTYQVRGNKLFVVNMKSTQLSQHTCLTLIIFYQDVIEGKICYENNLGDVDQSEIEINRHRRDTDILRFTLTDGFNTELGELDIDVSCSPSDL